MTLYYSNKNISLIKSKINGEICYLPTNSVLIQEEDKISIHIAKKNITTNEITALCIKYILASLGYLSVRHTLICKKAQIDINNTREMSLYVKLPKNPITVLSYNIMWERMTNPDDLPDKNKNDKCPTMSRDGKNTQCLENVVEAIDKYGLCDFIALQEATNYDIIKKKFIQLSKMKHMHYRPQKGKSLGEEIVSFWDGTKYHLDDEDASIGGYFGTNIGRPFLMLFFKEGICFINIHPGHGVKPKNLKQGAKYEKDDIANFDESINRSITGNDKVIEKIKTYRIIIAGDFNNELDKHDLIFFKEPYIENGRQFYETKADNTCCDVDPSKLDKTVDHILYTIPGGVRTTLEVTLPASDHLPIYAILPSSTN